MYDIRIWLIAIWIVGTSIYSMMQDRRMEKINDEINRDLVKLRLKVSRLEDELYGSGTSGDISDSDRPGDIEEPA